MITVVSTIHHILYTIYYIHSNKFSYSKFQISKKYQTYIYNSILHHIYPIYSPKPTPAPTASLKLLSYAKSINSPLFGK